MSVTKLYRIGNYLHKRNIPGAAFLFKLLIRVVFNCAVDPRTKIGKGSFFAYGGIAVVIHRLAVIGDNVTISQCVTIGGRSKISRLPTVGNNVYIGAGAIILGDISIGDNAVIGAGSVLIDNVAIGEVWAGVPARKIN
ncbi:serine O-acetyltransferase [Pseudoalteromonas fuliginea]|uniref:serine O-acetyltransferase n=1 Tax=Pseudoalteromonas fuliginea TaxID=1872678 RepID=UPI00051858B6|nr:serine acetyltransferase [Pseudoalteromonas fuliginea]KJZ27708.1 hypothetical protein TW82_10685 [Pseudoalteromonas fuliginea]